MRLVKGSSIRDQADAAKRYWYTRNNPTYKDRLDYSFILDRFVVRSFVRLFIRSFAWRVMRWRTRLKDAREAQSCMNVQPTASRKSDN